jgi:hypothetical protein
MAVEQKDIARILEDTQANARALPNVKQKQFIQYRVGADKFRTEIKDGAVWRKLDIEGTFVKTDQINRFSQLQEFGASLSTDGVVSYVNSLDGLASGDFRTGKLGALGVGWNLQVYDGASWVDVLDVNDAGDNINTPGLTQQTTSLEVVNKQEFIDDDYTIYREQGFIADYGYRDYITRQGIGENIYHTLKLEDDGLRLSQSSNNSYYEKVVQDGYVRTRLSTNSTNTEQVESYVYDTSSSVLSGTNSRYIKIESNTLKNTINSTAHALELQYSFTTELTVDSGLVAVANDLTVGGVATIPNIIASGLNILTATGIDSRVRRADKIGRLALSASTDIANTDGAVILLNGNDRTSGAGDLILSCGTSGFIRVLGLASTAGGAGNERLWVDGTTVKYS